MEFERSERMWSMDNFENVEDVEAVIGVANEHFDRHISVFRFTTGWKMCFGTASAGQAVIRNQPGHMSFQEAVTYLLENKPNTYGVKL